MAIATASLTVLTLTSCGGGDQDLPTCSSVWVSGKTLPRDYNGCVDANSNPTADLVYDCVDGPDLTIHEAPDKLAVLGSKIENRTDESYDRLFDACKP